MTRRAIALAALVLLVLEIVSAADNVEDIPVPSVCGEKCGSDGFTYNDDLFCDGDTCACTDGKKCVHGSCRFEQEVGESADAEIIETDSRQIPEPEPVHVLEVILFSQYTRAICTKLSLLPNLLTARLSTRYALSVLGIPSVAAKSNVLFVVYFICTLNAHSLLYLEDQAFVE